MAGNAPMDRMIQELVMRVLIVNKFFYPRGVIA